MTGLPSAEKFSAICEATGLVALAATRKAKLADTVATMALVRTAVEMAKMDGRTPAEIAAWLRKTADELESGPQAPDA